MILGNKLDFRAALKGNESYILPSAFCFLLCHADARRSLKRSQSWCYVNCALVQHLLCWPSQTEFVTQKPLKNSGETHLTLSLNSINVYIQKNSALNNLLFQSISTENCALMSESNEWPAKDNCGEENMFRLWKK